MNTVILSGALRGGRWGFGGVGGSAQSKDLIFFCGRPTGRRCERSFDFAPPRTPRHHLSPATPPRGTPLRMTVGFSTASLLRSLLVLVAFLSAPSAHACSIPVFRYGLDRWPADPFQLQISAEDAADEGVGRFMRNLTDSTPINVGVTRSKEPGPSRLLFPHGESDTPAAWNGKLDGPTLETITNSKSRGEIVRRILDGDVGVWLLVESGQKDADDRAAAALEKRLRYLEQVAQLPSIDPNDPSSQLGPGPALRVSFSLQRVRRDDPAEQSFLKMLAGPKNDDGVSAGPWFALVFGRGRALGAWPAEGFGDEQIDEACLFLLGACSCQVKRMNPGWDLLLNHDWTESLQAIGFPTAAKAEEAPAAAAPAKPAAPKPETVTITAAPSANPTPTSGAPGRRIAIASGLLLLLGSALVWRTIRRPL